MGPVHLAAAQGEVLFDPDESGSGARSPRTGGPRRRGPRRGPRATRTRRRHGTARRPHANPPGHRWRRGPRRCAGADPCGGARPGRTRRRRADRSPAARGPVPPGGGARPRDRWQSPQSRRCRPSAKKIAPHDVGGAGSDNRVLVGLPGVGALAEEPFELLGGPEETEIEPVGLELLQDRGIPVEVEFADPVVRDRQGPRLRIRGEVQVPSADDDQLLAVRPRSRGSGCLAAGRPRRSCSRQ